ncbi:MAG TPA: PPOX class F420-dependent oxidoreductase [Pseudonocardia sp.]
MAELTPEVREFLSHATRTGKLGYLASDGRPLVVPVWFVVHEDELWFNTDAGSAKGRAIARDPRLALCVDFEEPPFGFVQIQGVATVSEDADELLASAIEIGTRYMGAERGAEFGRRNAVPGELLVKLRPTKVIANMNLTG